MQGGDNRQIAAQPSPGWAVFILGAVEIGFRRQRNEGPLNGGPLKSAAEVKRAQTKVCATGAISGICGSAAEVKGTQTEVCAT